jgi:hypothetical protein
MQRRGEQIGRALARHGSARGESEAAHEFQPPQPECGLLGPPPVRPSALQSGASLLAHSPGLAKNVQHGGQDGANAEPRAALPRRGGRGTR